MDEKICKDYKVINHTDDELEVLDENAEDDGYYYYDPEEPDINLFRDFDIDDEDIEEPVEEQTKKSDWDWFDEDELDYDRLREELEENEDEVECQGCFETFNKADCVKGEHGYYCKECAGLHEAEEKFENDFTDEAFSPKVARVSVGDTIEIIDMDGEPRYSGRVGVVEYIDDEGQLHGTWGGCAVIPDIDTFKKISNEELTEAKKDKAEISMDKLKKTVEKSIKEHEKKLAELEQKFIKEPFTSTKKGDLFYQINWEKRMINQFRSYLGLAPLDDEVEIKGPEHTLTEANKWTKKEVEKLKKALEEPTDAAIAAYKKEVPTPTKDELDELTKKLKAKYSK